MAKANNNKTLEITPIKKKTRQGNSKKTKLSASSANGRKKRYNRQGKG